MRSRALEGRRVSSKSPSRVLDQDERVAGRNEEEKYPHARGAIYLSSNQIDDLFTKSKHNKVVLMARPAITVTSSQSLK